MINCKVAAAGADNTNANPNNIFTIKDTKSHVPVVTLSAIGIQKLSKLLYKGFERTVYWNQYKTKSENKYTTNEFGYFLESNFVGVNRLFFKVYSNQGNNAKIFNARKYYWPKGIIKSYNFIINAKSFYAQVIDSDITRCKEIRKLTTGQGEDHTTGCLLDYDYVVRLGRQKELGADPKVIQ